MFDKFSSEHDDFLAMFGFGPGSTAVQSAQPESPSSDEPPSSEGEEFAEYYANQNGNQDFSLFEEPEKEQTPAVKQDFSLFEEPKQKTTPEKTKQDFSLFEEPVAKSSEDFSLFELPSWFDPSWKLPPARKNETEPKFDDSLKNFENFELFEFPTEPTPPRKTRESKTKDDLPISEKLNEPIEPASEVLDLSNFENAKDYLISFEGTDPLFDTIADGIIEVTNILALSRQNRSQKQVANALGFVMGSIESLLQKPELLGKNKDKLTQAASTVNKFYGEQVAKLESIYQDKVHNQIIRQVEGPKPRPLQRRSSSWHGENVIFTRNRAIDILRNEDNVTVPQAEEQAQDEWNGIVELIEDKAKDFSPADKATFQSMFAKAILGGDSFEDASTYIEGLIDRGTNQSDTFYENVNTKAEDEDVLDTLDELTNAEFVSDELDTIPDENVKNNLQSLIVDFAKSAHQLLTLGMNWEGREPPPDVMDVAQQLYQHVISVSSKISSTPQELKEKAFDNGNIFKDVYIATSKVNEYTDTFGIEDIDTPNITGAELAEMGNMTISDPTKKKLTEEEKALGPQKKRVRNPEVEKAAHERYMDLIRHHGRLADYYNQRRQHSAMKAPALRGRGDERRIETEEEFLARRDPSKEKVRLTKKDATLVNSEADGWKKSGLNKKNQRSVIASLRARNIDNMMKFWRTAVRSWLPKDQLDAIADRRFQDRVQKLTAALDHLNSYKLQSNEEVISALEDLIQKLPQAWSSTKEQVEIESLRSSRVFRPGEWTEWDQESRRGVPVSQRKGLPPNKRRQSKLSSVIYFSDIFYRFASEK